MGATVAYAGIGSGRGEEKAAATSAIRCKRDAGAIG